MFVDAGHSTRRITSAVRSSPVFSFSFMYCFLFPVQALTGDGSKLDGTPLYTARQASNPTSPVKSVVGGEHPLATAAAGVFVAGSAPTPPRGNLTAVQVRGVLGYY